MSERKPGRPKGTRKPKNKVQSFPGINVVDIDEEKLEKIAQREWDRKPIVTSDMKKLFLLQRLTGPKTVEGKKKVLRNLRMGKLPTATEITKSGGLDFTRAVLNKDEQEIYNFWKNKLLEDYELNNSADQIMLNDVLLEIVLEHRIFNEKIKHPGMDIDRALTECRKRKKEALDALGMLRKQRLGQDQKVILSIANLAENIDREEKQKLLQAEKLRLEEEEYMRKRKEKKSKLYIDAEYEISDNAGGES